MSALRPDLVFSYWIYLWYIFYAFKIISYSPKFPLIIGLIDNLVMLLLMLYFGTSKKTILLFLFINMFIKVIPLYYLRNENIKLIDIYFTIGLFIAFIIWLHLNKQSLIGNIKLVHDSLLYGKGATPFIHFFNVIERNYKKLEII